MNWQQTVWCGDLADFESGEWRAEGMSSMRRGSFRRMILLIPALIFLPGCGDKELEVAADDAVVPPVAETRPRNAPKDPGEVARIAIAEGRLVEARKALQDIQDEDYRHFLLNQFNAAMEQNIRRRANEDAVKTLEAIIRGEGEVETFWIEVAMNEFLESDRDSALKWHAAREPDLDAEQNDRVLLALARSSPGKLDWRALASIRDRIVNPDVRQAVANEVGASMERDLRNQVREDAEETMKRLLRGDSGFETFWIEVAINEFLAVNPSRAKYWYAMHGSSLGEAQHDRVALAFARAANAAGDRKLAGEWAGQIREEELRRVVEGEIGR
jgi:hypothetical protein